MNELSIVIPCVSTIEPLPKFIDELSVFLTTNPSDIDIIVVVNEKVESTDHIAKHVYEKYPWLKFEVLQRSGDSRCWGALARFGIAYSTSRYVVFVSPYGEDDLSIIASMLVKIRQGSQVVQATRFSSKEDAKKVPSRFRSYQSIYRFLIKLLLGYKISDSTYGFKMFDRIFIQAIGLNQNGYSICPEITLKALLARGEVEYVPIGIRSAPINKDFKLFGEGMKYMWLLLRGFGHRLGILWF